MTTLLLDLHGGLAALAPCAPLLHGGPDDARLVYYSARPDERGITTAAEELEPWLRRRDGGHWQLLVLVDSSAAVSSSPRGPVWLEAALSPRVERLERCFLSTLRSAGWSPRRVWILALDDVEQRDRLTGTPLDAAARLGWELDTRGWATDTTELPYLFNEADLNSVRNAWQTGGPFSFSPEDSLADAGTVLSQPTRESLARRQAAVRDAIASLVTSKVAALAGAGVGWPAKHQIDAVAASFTRAFESVVQNPNERLDQFDPGRLLEDRIADEIGLRAAARECLLIRVPLESGSGQSPQTMLRLGYLLRVIASDPELPSMLRCGLDTDHHRVEDVDLDDQEVAALLREYIVRLRSVRRSIEVTIASPMSAELRFYKDDACGCPAPERPPELPRLRIGWFRSPHDPNPWGTWVERASTALGTREEDGISVVRTCLRMMIAAPARGEVQSVDLEAETARRADALETARAALVVRPFPFRAEHDLEGATRVSGMRARDLLTVRPTRRQFNAAALLGLLPVLSYHLLLVGSSGAGWVVIPVGASALGLLAAAWALLLVRGDLAARAHEAFTSAASIAREIDSTTDRQRAHLSDLCRARVARLNFDVVSSQRDRQRQHVLRLRYHLARLDAHSAAADRLLRALPVAREPAAVSMREVEGVRFDADIAPQENEVYGLDGLSGTAAGSRYQRVIGTVSKEGPVAIPGLRKIVFIRDDVLQPASPAA